MTKKTTTSNTETKKQTAETKVSTKTPVKKVQTSEPTAETTAVTATKEPDLYATDFVKDALKYKKAIAAEYSKVEKSFLAIAFSIHWLYDNKGYTPLGYDNIYDLAKKEFDIARGTTNNFINVVYRFGERDELGNFTGKIDTKYEKYSSSKLILLLNLTDEEITSLSPETSVRELKKQIRCLLDKEDGEIEDSKTTSSKSVSGCVSFETDEETEDAGNFAIHRQALITCTKADYDGKIDTIDEYILRAFKAHPDCKIEIVLVTADDAVSDAADDSAHTTES